VVVRAAADGYALLPVQTANAISAALYDKLNFNFIRDIAAVASIIRVPAVMEVNPSAPAHTVPEFIAYAKANNMGSAGNGSPTHVSGELFKVMTGVNMLHVPYRSTIAPLTDLIGGQVQYEATGFMGIVAPKNTPPEIIARLNKEINAGLADPKIKSTIAGLGYTVSQSSPADFGKLIADQTEKWGKVIPAADIKVE
jgi:tripartite-type tricarboxylate transporter receptor subunit TctC